MRIAIQTLGTRGDVQPFVALALGLQAHGHEVQLAAPMQFAPMVRGWDIPFAALPGEFLDLIDSPEGKAAIAGGQGFSAGFKLLKHVRPLMRKQFDAEWGAVREFAADLLVYHPKSISAPHIAEALHIPSILASPLPGFTPTSAFPSPMLPFASLGPLNRTSHALAIKGGGVLFSKTIREWRSASLRLEAKRRTTDPLGTLYAYSRHIVPVPRDWGKDVLVSGYWFLDDEEWRPPPDLLSFLDSGEAPIYVGFGSMPGLDPERTSQIVFEALARTGKRGLLAIGGGALAAENAPPDVHVIASAPHSRLFPHVAAAIHHGGAGTTAAALRAGIPSVICPFFGDQPFWARRVHELGAAPPALDRTQLSADALTAAILQTDNAAMRRKAAALGAKIHDEDGIARAVTFIEIAADRGSAIGPEGMALHRR